METQHIGLEIRTLSNLIHRKINQMVAEEEETLTIHQIWVLDFLITSKGNRVAQRDIEKKFSVRRSTASHMLKLMENNGYIRRDSVSEDARIKQIVLTEKGREAQERMKDRLLRFEAILQAGITEEELQNFFHMIERFQQNIE